MQNSRIEIIQKFYDSLDESKQYEFDERAGIYEFDANLRDAEAEMKVFQEMIKDKK